MIEIQESSNDAVLEIKIIKEATEADIEHIKPILQKHIAETNEPRLLLILEEMADWGEVVGLWSDLSLDGDDVEDFHKIALVGDASWKGWLTSTIENLVSIDLKFFGFPDMEHARKWVEQ